MKAILITDMDGTLLAKRTVDVLSKAFGLENRLKQIDKESKGLPAFKVSEKVARIFQGIPKVRMEEVFDTIPLNPNAEKFIIYVKQKGLITAIATDSYQFLAERLAKRLKVDMVYGHKVEFSKGVFTGRLLSKYQCLEISGCKRYYICKLWFLQRVRERFEAPIITIGDGESDYCMSTKADLAIAFKPKCESLVKVAKLVVESFDELLPLVRTTLNRW